MAEISHEILVFLRPRVSSEVSGFLVASPCLWGKLQNLSFLEVSKQVVVLFCVAGAALCDIMITCGKLFSVAFHKMSCSFRGRPSILEISVIILHGRRSISDVSHCLLYTPHSTLHPLHFTLHTLHSTLYTPHSTLYTLQSTLYTPHSTLHTPHSTHYLLHSTLNTLHSTRYTPHCSLHTLHFTLHTLQSTLYTQHSTLYTQHFTVHTPHSTL